MSELQRRPRQLPLQLEVSIDYRSAEYLRGVVEREIRDVLDGSMWNLSEHARGEITGVVTRRNLNVTFKGMQIIITDGSEKDNPSEQWRKV